MSHFIARSVRPCSSRVRERVDGARDGQGTVFTDRSQGGEIFRKMTVLILSFFPVEVHVCLCVLCGCVLCAHESERARERERACACVRVCACVCVSVVDHAELVRPIRYWCVNVGAF